ncbi:MAG: putative N6-adenine-specific methylase [Gemmatimonadaceae bacterium]|jgi:putative N6-adenine-specific DNA methylase|nr:putative N6-adenine-specific methylase [Gemmatimonadaceae bacterium]
MSDSSSFSFNAFASTGPGLESIAAGELKARGIRGRQEIGGVAFSADLQRLYEANLWLRTATRVLVRLGSFHASTFYELERRAKKLPWAEFLPANGKVRVRVTCRKSKLYHSDAVGERVLSAIVGSASRVIEGSADVDTDAVETADIPDHEAASEGSAAQLFVVRIVNDECEVSADSSGELLHKRGYRQEIAKAPLRETIAAAMVLASGWKGNEPLLDPMCGSGTIPIEAALIARRIAPGLRRNFQFMDWPGFDAERWTRVLDDARAAVTDFTGEILGSDRDAGAVLASARNAERAGVSENVRFSQGAVSGSIAAIDDSVRDSGWILTNPPYGVRVGESDDLRNLYAKFGSALRSKPGWRLGVLTSDSALVQQTKLPLKPRFSTSNGGIPVSYFVSEKTSRAEVHSIRIGVPQNIGR